MNPVRLLRIDPFQLQREARELADLAQTVSSDLDTVNHGRPKARAKRLKRIEPMAQASSQ